MTLGDRIVVMKDGLVQQVGTPLELYRQPANRFVAGFIGSPAMNFITATITADERAATATAPGLELRFTEANAAILRKRAGETVVLGIRPQHLLLNDGQPGLLRLEAVLSTSEQLGDQQLLDARIGVTPIRVAGVDPFLKLTDGTQLPLGVLPGNVHLFDPVHGSALY
jgi:multiple sugar transport system ATP-binding protein